MQTTPDSRSKEADRSQTYVFSRDGKLRGRLTGGSRPCPLEGCRGTRLAVRWEDGSLTYPCTAGMEVRADGHYQIS